MMVPLRALLSLLMFGSVPVLFGIRRGLMTEGSSCVENVNTILAHAHDARTSLMEQLSNAVFLVHPGQPAGELTRNVAARKAMSIKERVSILSQRNHSPSDHELFDIGVGAREVQVDDEDGEPMRRITSPYHMLPLYGRPPDAQLKKPRPDVIVTVDLFQPDLELGTGHSSFRSRYSEGLVQMVASLPHINRRMNLHLAVFHDDTVPQSFLNHFVGKAHVSFVPIRELQKNGNVSPSLLQVEGSETNTVRTRWHDIRLLETEGLPRLGKASLPDVLMTYDVDSLLDSPALDWWVQHVMSHSEYIFVMEGTNVLGPNQIPRAFDGSTFTMAPKRVPQTFKWPGSLDGTWHGELPNGESNSMLSSRDARRRKCTNVFSLLVKDGYGSDEERMALLLNLVLQRDGPRGVHVVNYPTYDAFTVATINTGEVAMMCNGRECDQGEPTYALWYNLD